MNIQSLWQLFFNTALRAEDVTTLTDQFSAFQNRLSTPIVMVFWLAFGAVTYTLIWLTQNVFFIAKTEVAESKYISPNPNPRKYWESALTSNLFLVLVVLIWIFFIGLYLRVALPYLSNLFNESFFSGSIYHQAALISIAILLNAAAIYLILLMLRVINSLWQTNRP
jgi:hypothetical protein